jgi:hypothetical protein
VRLKVDQDLYILAFKNEPLIKVGLSKDAYVRSLSLGFERVDFKRSYIVQARDQAAISVLERNLKTFFSTQRVLPSEPLSSGNTETFQSSVLPQMLEAIEAFKKAFAGAEFRIQQDLCSLHHSEVLQLCRSCRISWADMVLAPSVAGLFKWRQFEPEVILLAVG